MSSPVSRSRSAAQRFVDGSKTRAGDWFALKRQTLGDLSPTLSKLAGRTIGFAFEPLAAMFAVGIATGLFELFWPSADTSTLAVVFVLVTAMSTYAAGTAIGLVSLLASALALIRWLGADQTYLVVPDSAGDRAIITIFIACSAVIVWLIRHVQAEGSSDRQDALAARSAASALSAIETVAATQQELTPQVTAQLYEAMLRSVVGVNRAHAGALVLTQDEVPGMMPAASYGFGPHAEQILTHPEGLGEFLVRVGVEGRPRQLSASEQTSHDIPVKSVLGAPIVSDDGELLGVLVVGLLVEHNFSQSEIRRLEALASQVSGILQTMSATSQREAQLQRAKDEQQRLERVIAAVPDALVVTAPPDGHIVATNEAAEIMFGAGMEEGKLEDKLSYADAASGDLLPFQRAHQHGETAASIECIVTGSGERTTPVLASAAPIHDLDGSLMAVVSAYRDISSLKEAERLKDEFLSVVSHELRSPLTPIRGYVQLVARELSKEGGHDAQVVQLNSISGHVDRITRLVDDLLDVSSLRSGILEITTGPVDLVESTKSIVRAHQDMTDAPIRFESPPDTEFSVEGQWDADRVSQVIDNLIGNAVKYSPGDSTIIVRVFEDNESAVVEVEDDGPGIEQLEREDIFTAFHRTADAISGQIPGLGLGLYICHELISAHGGSISVREADAGGSIFRVELPLPHDQPDGSDGNSSGDPLPITPMAVSEAGTQKEPVTGD